MSPPPPTLPRGGVAVLEEHGQVARSKLTGLLILVRDAILFKFLPKIRDVIQYILDRRIVFLGAGIVTGMRTFYVSNAFHP